MNIKKIITFFCLSLFVNSLFAQSDGYWDKERATKKEIVVSARGRIVLKTDDLPIGTTEIVFRITILDGNQEMANSLVSILKSIPDPTGISQGSAGAVFLLSKISGEDKCRYAIFSNEISATEYKRSGTTSKACYDQNEPVSKDAKRLSIDKSLCLLPNSNAMWFGFESKNWVMNQKIVLELVPWVNTKLASGWNVENRKLILNQFKSTDLAKKMIPADELSVCVLDKLQKEYKFQEFQQLLPIEKSKVFADMGNSCLLTIGSSAKLYAALRNEAIDLVQQGKYGEAMEKINTIMLYGKAKAIDFSTLGYCYIRTKQYEKAIKFLKEGAQMDDSELLIQLNLAHAYLFNKKFGLAKSIYKKYQLQNVTNSLSWIQKVEQDFEIFEKAGLPSLDFKKVLKMFKE